jgi:hypothetical protein
VLNVELNIDGRIGQVIDGGASEQDTAYERVEPISAKCVKPSILEGLRTGLYGGEKIKPDTVTDKTKLKEITI